MLPPSRRSGGRRRLDLRLVVGVVLLAAGMLGTVGLVRQAGQKTPVLVTARAVPPGQILTEADVAVAEVGLSPGVAALSVTDRSLLVGHTAAGPLAEGQVLTAAAVADTLPLAEGEVGMSVPANPASAVGGVLQPGHWVRVVATPEGGGSASTTVVLDQARVIAVITPDQTRSVEGEGAVTLAVPQDQAPTLAGAAAQGSLDLLLLSRSAVDATEP